MENTEVMFRPGSDEVRRERRPRRSSQEDYDNAYFGGVDDPPRQKKRDNGYGKPMSCQECCGMDGCGNTYCSNYTSFRRRSNRRKPKAAEAK